MSKIMLISVGGTAAPIMASIKVHSPDKIIFFVSKGSRKQVSEQIIPEVFNKNGEMIDYEIIVTENEQNIGESTRILLNEVPKAIKKFGDDNSWADIVDYTGGTKTMSAAIVWASSKFPCQFNYVGGEERSKDGLGIVKDGREIHVTLQNPWDTLAYFELNDAMKLFNNGQYANSAELFTNITNKVTNEKSKRVFSILAELVEGYSQWDMFNHQDAQRLIGKNIKPLADVAVIADIEKFYITDLELFSTQVKTNFEFLQKIQAHHLSLSLIYDLLANALRRAELEKKYEDATARVYSAIEKMAKFQLQSEYSIDNANCRLEQIPDNLKDEYSAKYANTENKLQFGLIASFELLNHFDNLYGRRFAELKKVNAHLDERNRSILGHGMQAIDKSKFDDLFNDALSILGIEKDSLPIFPMFIV